MIHYALRCGGGHEFDGWFVSSAGFEAQAAGGHLACPICADTAVHRALMAPRLGGNAPAPVAEPKPPAAPAKPPMPDGMRAVLARIRAEVERRCDYVGPGFAAEARAIHGGHAPHRGIYGEASADEVSALEADGIEIANIPWVPRADA